MKSKAISSGSTPAGTSTWYANMFTSSRFHGIAFPAAVMVKPTMFRIGPVGPCSPGIHSGYRSVMGPAVAGMVILT